METSTATVHASAVLIGRRATLIRGPAGGGKSRLAWALIEAGACGLIPFARLVADDRVEVLACHGRLVLRAPSALSGLIEVRGLGIRRVACEATAVAGLVVDLAATDAGRMPTAEAMTVTIDGVQLPRLPVAVDSDALSAVLATLRSDAT